MIELLLKKTLVPILIFLFIPLNAQNFEKIKEINFLLDSLKTFQDDSAKLQFNSEIHKNIVEFFSESYSFSIPVDSFKKFGILEAPDKKFRICTWNVSLNNGLHQFFGIIQMNPGKSSNCMLHILKNEPSNENIISQSLRSDHWFGALYYQMVKVKAGKKEVYTLLGTKFNDLFTTKKVIETLSFDEFGPVFGMPILELGLKLEKRVIFEFSINARMGLRYDDDMEMIIYDHLSPSLPIHTGNYKFYGPDFSFDGYKFEKEKWVYVPNIVMKNSKRTEPRKPIRKSNF